jgi:hypothetical protein
MSKFARSKEGRDTVYMQFHTPHSARGGENSLGVIDKDTGQSPIARWLTYALSFDEAVSVPTVGMVYDCEIPPGTLIESARIRVDTAFVGTGTNDVDVGDPSQTDGWIDGVDLSAALTTAGIPVWFRDVSTDYMVYSDIVLGTSGPQLYYNGGTIRVLIATADDLTAGEAVLQFLTNSYCEPINAEA